MGLGDTYNYFIHEISDPRLRHWPLMGNPLPILLITFSYLYFVLRCGPNYMRNKPAYNLQTFIKFYNLFQIVTNSFIVWSVVDAGFFRDVGLSCVQFSFSEDPSSIRFMHIVYGTLYLKIIDYVETAVFVLRKKDRQISFLHLYHHVTTVFVNWVTAMYFASGMSMFFIVVNCSVHVVMYTYYFLSTFGPTVQRIAQPIKPLITMMQMVQFWILIAYCLQAYLPWCNVSLTLGNFMIADLLINFFLFYNFYKQSYTSKKKK